MQIDRQLLSNRVILGCGRLQSGLLTKESTRILESAYDLGVRQYDLAPLYGQGRAERTFADIFSGVQANVRVTTKAGIARPYQNTNTFTSFISDSNVYLKSKAKKLFFFRGLKKNILPSGSSEGNMDVAFIKNSFEESLDQLRLSSLDTFLLHEPRVHTVSDELIEYLQSLKSTGLVKKTGLGTGLGVGEISYFGDVVQTRYDNDLWLMQGENNIEFRVHGIFRHNQIDHASEIKKILKDSKMNIVYSTSNVSRLENFVSTYFSY